MEIPPGMTNYYLIETRDLEGKPGVDGGLGKRGLGKRGEPGQRITAYIGVSSIDEYVAKVEQLGGRVVMPRTAVPGWGYLAVCFDTEDNMFGLWQEDRSAK
jgi:predicted enzyme related to lactoylglutathione lyase